MKKLPDNSVDSIVTDPPYGLSFMGKHWDYDVPSQEIWEECLRVLKPGGHLLSFAGTRTQHRMAVRIEDAGFEIRDMIAWVYGSGFPKSLNIGKAVDKLQGNEREVVALRTDGAGNGNSENVMYDADHKFVATKVFNETKGTSPWEGWGTALKPSLEPITVARKPLIGTVAENVLTHGTGGINIDGTRVNLQGSDPDDNVCVCYPKHTPLHAKNAVVQKSHDGAANEQSSAPENVDTHGSEKTRGILQDDTSKATTSCSAETLTESMSISSSMSGSGNEQTEQSLKGTKSITSTDSTQTTDSATCSVCGKPTTSNTTGNLGRWPANLIHDGSEEVVGLFPNDNARFFYAPKASKKDRDEGLEGFEPAKQGTKTKHERNFSDDFREFGDGVSSGHKNLGQQKNYHPTVKPTDLMRYLCRLVTPKGGTVLDPFMGSGSTGKAAIMEGFNFIGMEKEEEYVNIARARINAVSTQEKMF